MQIQFNKKNSFGMNIFASTQTNKVSLIQDKDSRFYVRMNDNGSWIYPEWQGDGFDSQEDAEMFLSMCDLESTDCETVYYDPDELDFLYNLLGFEYNQDADIYEWMDTDQDIGIECNPNNPLDVTVLDANGSEHMTYDSIDDMIHAVESTILQCHMSVFSKRVPVKAAINVKNLASQLFRVKSSNVWAYRLFMRDRHDKTGDLLVQFKHKNGGPGDVYIYYDVPFMIFRNWQATQSKGHYFWKHIRNYFKYSKLTGDKIGKLKNAVNHYENKIENVGEKDIDLTPTCRYMLDFVTEFISGKINREKFTSELEEYYDIGKPDMLSESRKFTDDFKTLIINVVNKHSDYGDDKLKRALSRGIKQLTPLLSTEGDK